MKYGLDFEFIDDGITIDVISIGIACEDGRELHLFNADCEFGHASEWVKDNVFPYIPELSSIYTTQGKGCISRTRPIVLGNRLRNIGWRHYDEIKDDVIKFADPDKYGKPSFYGYYADYDWVAFAQLFGTMMNLPDDFPMYCLDIKQSIQNLQYTEELPDNPNEHSALEDAKWNLVVLNMLEQYHSKRIYEVIKVFEMSNNFEPSIAHGLYSMATSIEELYKF